MPIVKSGWLLPTDQFIPLGELSHSELVIKFLSGLFVHDNLLGQYCFKDFNRFLKRTDYKRLNVADAVEDYAVLCLRWIKIGNAYNFNNNYTVTLANYDTYERKILHYEHIGYHVTAIPIAIHCYETIDAHEYEKLDVETIISSGQTDYQKYMTMA